MARTPKTDGRGSKRNAVEGDHKKNHCSKGGILRQIAPL